MPAATSWVYPLNCCHWGISNHWTIYVCMRRPCSHSYYSIILSGSSNSRSIVSCLSRYDRLYFLQMKTSDILTSNYKNITFFQVFHHSNKLKKKQTIITKNSWKLVFKSTISREQCTHIFQQIIIPEVWVGDITIMG